jgi:transposase
MMGRLDQDQGQLFYSFCLDEVVPDDHLVRQIAAVLDLSWVHAESLPRIETVIDIENRSCPCCGGALHAIGEDVAERLDVIPAQFRVLVVHRPKYACRACPGTLVQAPAPSRLIEGGLPTESLVAHIIVGKYADHLPLYRQAQIYSRQGIELDRSTLAAFAIIHQAVRR